MSIYQQHPIDLTRITTYPLSSRRSKVTVEDFARPLTDEQARAIQPFIASLPRILAGDTLREVASAIVKARKQERAVIWGIGGHVIKTGLAPILIDLMRRGFVTAIATNGSGVIHDFEVAISGSTSEDVDESLGAGRFGMAEETGRLINEAINAGASDGLGIGEAVGRMLNKMAPRFAEYSLLHASFVARVPVTAHVTIGTDIIHLHKLADGASIGTGTHRDFRLFTSVVKGLSGGGVYLNIGSAVTLPEVFLKAVTVLRNLCEPLEDFTTADFDFIGHYRPLTNVVRRPVANGAGRGFHITGHHELTIPMLAAAIVGSSI
jgi:hypothetical protein